jgi:hypothetical protein
MSIHAIGIARSNSLAAFECGLLSCAATERKSGEMSWKVHLRVGSISLTLSDISGKKEVAISAAWRKCFPRKKKMKQTFLASAAVADQIRGSCC